MPCSTQGLEGPGRPCRWGSCQVLLWHQCWMQRCIPCGGFSIQRWHPQEHEDPHAQARGSVVLGNRQATRLLSWQGLKHFHDLFQHVSSVWVCLRMGYFYSTPKFDGESPFSLHQWPIMAILAGYHGIEQPPKKNKRMQKSNKSLFQKDFTHFNVFLGVTFLHFSENFILFQGPPLPCAPPATHWFITHMNSITISITHTIINYS